MYARVACATGWTWEYIGQCLTLPRLYALYDHWNEYPPVHESVAVALGLKTGAAATAPAAAPAKIDNAAITRNMHADPRKLVWMTRPNG